MNKIISLLLIFFVSQLTGAIIVNKTYDNIKYANLNYTDCDHCYYLNAVYICKNCEIEKYCSNFCALYDCRISNYIAYTKECRCSTCFRSYKDK